MPLGEGGPHERKKEQEALPFKRRYFTVIGSSNVKWLQTDTSMPLILTNAGDDLFRNVNIDNLG